MPAQPQPATPARGQMDNPYYDWSPITTRPALRWPDDARIAVAVVMSLEHLEWYPAPDTALKPSARSAAYPRLLDVHMISQWEYGNRVGVFRVTDVLDAHGIRPTVAMDAAVMRRSPYLVEHLQRRGAEFVGHGISSEQTLSDDMPEARERALIAETSAAIESATGRRPRGWVGSDYVESTRTVALLAEAGYEYVLDWPNDEQPYPMKVPAGRMTSLPQMIELDDVVTVVGRSVTAERYGRMITEQFDRMYVDGAASGRLFILPVHPWVMGQPFRIRHFAAAIAHIARHPAVWLTTGAEILDAYRAG